MGEVVVIKVQTYNRFGVLWIVHYTQAVKKGDHEAIQRSIAGASTATNEYELFIFMVTAEDHVVGLTPKQRKTYAQVGTLDSFKKLDLPDEFVSAWVECHDRLASKYQGFFSDLALVFELAYPSDEPACPSLANSAATLSAMAI